MRTQQRVARTTFIVVLAAATPALAGSLPGSLPLTHVPNPQPKVVGNTAPNIVSPELALQTVAQGSTRLEPNSDPLTKFYGYDNDGSPMLPAPGDVQSTMHNVEAQKTEPDKNTYLVTCSGKDKNCLHKLTGPDANFDYGTHFLFQGHENGLVNEANTALIKGYITRINLDVDSEADGNHRVTLLATTDVNGAPIPLIDGSTWDPWAQRLLFTSENGNNGGVWQATPDYPSQVEDISCVLGRGGYEGIQNDSDGNLWIVEDSGGSTGVVNSHAKRPNSFVYRFRPNDKTDLKKGGKLQALQVTTSSGPLVFNAADSADTAIKDPKVQELHTCGKLLQTKWVNLKTTNRCDPAAAFDANALAKTAGATPFKRPENGQFHPGSKFTEFFFDETGDTDLRSEAAIPDPTFGGFGSVLKLTQPNGPSAATGVLELFYLSDAAHASFDNVGFWSKDQIVFVQDMGDTLHTQLQALDSAYLFDVTQNYCGTQLQPTRILAEGRDPSATIDSGLGSISGNGFQNDGDNEITGWHTSNGNSAPCGILGAKAPTPFKNGWRTFFTQQHGDNITYEVVKRFVPWSEDDED